VVDDMDMGITHVIRGDDHINNTPRQINILRALGAELPSYAHVPMILGSDGARLSKRHGAVSVMQYRDDGILPEALLNYLVRLGWSHGDQELFSQQELLELFRIEDVNRAPSTFNPEKLLWVNQEKLKAMDIELLLKTCEPHFADTAIDTSKHRHAGAAIELVRDRCQTLLEIVEQSRFFFVAPTSYDPAALKKWVKPNSAEIVEALIEQFTGLSDWRAEAIQAIVQATVDRFEVGFAKVAQPIRIAVTGSTQSPSIDVTLEVLGQVETLARLNQALTVFRV
ncbi:MAG: glutamate--tRNA ligase family protein, partial [Pseudomonadota bacterium]